ncbi:B10-1 protein [Pseudolycoriella hygida]|uniref:B10-1 protein n=1 Tax=Pseudolycoriella hygida TaxID=35572 RepID=A0A9Q0S2T4_9DIPT|nr:B10-1 protein [Pseudolycoriella hygida]
MQAKSTFLFVLISSMKLASGTPILDGLLKGVLGGGGLPIGGGALGGGGGIPIVGGGKGGNGGSNVNVDGLLHGLNDILAEPLCSVGLGCDNCNDSDGCGCDGNQVPIGGGKHGHRGGHGGHGVTIGYGADKPENKMGKLFSQKEKINPLCIESTALNWKPCNHI